GTGSVYEQRPVRSRPGIELDKGQIPACVEACDATGHGAMVFGDLNDPASDISKALASYPSVALRPDLDLNPGVRYANL
ncbi:MAG: hypothetical protein P8Q23_07105, partial [Paracoccaceae bacterium]|nr:hypothetical protein [Paracoccaceae bacterium]